jgi:hypothetical protein
VSPLEDLLLTAGCLVLGFGGVAIARWLARDTFNRGQQQPPNPPTPPRAKTANPKPPPGRPRHPNPACTCIPTPTLKDLIARIPGDVPCPIHPKETS